MSKVCQIIATYFSLCKSVCEGSQRAPYFRFIQVHQSAELGWQSEFVRVSLAVLLTRSKSSAVETPSAAPGISFSFGTSCLQHISQRHRLKNSHNKSVIHSEG